MTVLLQNVNDIVNRLWPEDSAEQWDRVGLTVGSDTAEVKSILLALDVVQSTVSEAVELGVDLLLTHHPLLLRGVTSVAENTYKGAMISQLIRGNCALISAHTNADQPEDGVSDVLAQCFGLKDVRPIVDGSRERIGIGRVGTLAEPATLAEFARKVHGVIPETASGIRIAGDPNTLVHSVALCGGAGDSLLDHSLVRSADVYVTSDLRHHPASESREQSFITKGPALIDISHWAAESVWLETAAQQLRKELPDVKIVVSDRRTDPWDFVLGGDGRVSTEVHRVQPGKVQGRHGR